jgi:hypothetical protein
MKNHTFEASIRLIILTLCVLPVMSQPTVGLFATKPQSVEGGSVSFTLFRTEPFENSLEVRLKVGGTAKAFSDYNATWISSQTHASNDVITVMLPRGSPSVSLDIPLYLDGRIEGTETIEFTALESTNYFVGNPSQVQLRIRDVPPAPGPNLPPQAQWRSPAHGSLLVTNLLQLRVHTTDFDGDQRTVTFFNGPKEIATVSVGDQAVITDTGLYTFLWTNPPLGELGLYARVRDETGLETRTEPVQVTLANKIISPSALGLLRENFAMDSRDLRDSAVSEGIRGVAEFDLGNTDLSVPGIYLRLARRQTSYSEALGNVRIADRLIMYEADLALTAADFNGEGIEIAQFETDTEINNEPLWFDLTVPLKTNGWRKVGVRLERLPNSPEGPQTYFGECDLVLIPPQSINQPPILDAPYLGDVALTVGDFFDLAVAASDPDGVIDHVVLKGLSNLRPVFSLKKDGKYVFRFMPFVGQDKYYVWAVDNYGKQTGGFIANITVNPTDGLLLYPPIVTYMNSFPGGDHTPQDLLVRGAAGPGFHNLKLEFSPDFRHWSVQPVTLSEPGMYSSIEANWSLKTNPVFFRFSGRK